MTITYYKYINRGLDVLNSSKPDTKVDLSLKDLHKEKLIDDNYNIPKHPARPTRPILLSPKEMPKRSTSKNGTIALIHALAHIELNAIDLAWDLIVRFGNEINEEQFFSDWHKVAIDEANHFQMLNKELIRNNSFYGDLPAHNSLWDTAKKTSEDILDRLAIIPMFFEARGIDSSPKTIKKLESSNNLILSRILKKIYDDEITHLKIGTYWFEKICFKRGHEPKERWKSIVIKYLKKLPKGPFNIHGRKRAGMDESYWS